MFRGVVRSFVDKEVAPHVETWEAAGRMPKALWRRMGELGFFGLEYDEKYGGGGADVMMSAVLHEECARSRSGSFAMAVGVHCDMASPHLYWTGSEALKEKYLPAICRGEKLTAIAVTEAGGGSDVAAIRTRAVRAGDHYVINGAKMFITNGATADIYVLPRGSRRPRTAAVIRASRCSWWSATRRASASAGRWTRWACVRPTPPSCRSRTCGCRRRTCSAARAWDSTRSCACSSASVWWPASTRWPCPSGRSRTPSPT